MHHEGLFENYRIDAEHRGKRLDAFLAHEVDGFTRSQLGKAIARGEVLLNGSPPNKAGVKLREGDKIACRIQPPEPPGLEPDDIPLDILHEDEDLIVLIKPAGMVVHPAPGHPRGTLVNALIHHTQQLAPSMDGQPDSLRPGIVHRLDKDTSGVMVVTKSARATQILAAQFAAHSIDRRYLALAHSAHLPDQGSFKSGHSRHHRDRKRFTGHNDTPRRAITHFEVLERLHKKASLIACTLETGRTHQIRMHLSENHSPILGDVLYGGARGTSRLIARQALHAELLGFDHPNGERMRFESPPPGDFQAALEALRSGKSP